MNEVLELKEKMCDIGKRMYDREFVAANDGNISCKINDNEILITPTGVSKGFMTPDMILRVDFEGNVLEGNMKPSSEKELHIQVYKKNKDIRAVVHAHPVYSTAFAIAGKALDKKLMPEVVVFLGPVPVAKYGTPGTREIPDAVEKYLKDYKAVLLENHGTLSWGKTLEEAYFVTERLEFYAKLMMITRNLEGVKELSGENLAKLKSIMGS
ncbi:MAG: class II aldolase/adducin family protein [Firmicutes bacterium]|nr:class II aldolase/adducin family protein [Bacillota bacterium]